MKNKQQLFRPRCNALALEPRVLFDGAVAIAVDHHLVGGDHLAHPTTDAPEARTTSTVEAPPAPPAPNAPPTTLLVIDSRVTDYQSLQNDLPGNVMVRIINADESGLAAIDSAINSSSTLQSIQIISHGSSGSITLGSDTIDTSTLSNHSAEIQSWAPHLTADADILIYGCDVGAGPNGTAFLTQLADLTGADIAASTDATGSAARGGNWVLEQQTGPIEAKLVVSDTALANYDGLFAAPAIGGTIAGQTVNDNASKTVFSTVTITDADASDTQSLSVTLDSAAKGSLSNLGGGIYDAGTGVYTFTGTADAAQTAIRGLTFTPTANHVAPGTTETTTFSISVSDGTTTVTDQTSTVISTSINDAPHAFDDTASIIEDHASVTGNILSNDTDADHGDSKTVSALNGGTVGSNLAGSYGSLLLNADGSYTYTLDNGNAAVQALGVGQTLTETFHYTMKDTANAPSSADLTITIDGANDQPDMTPSTISLAQAEGLSTVFSVGNLLTNASNNAIWRDTDAGTAMGIAITSAPATDAASAMNGTWEYQLNTGTWTPFPSVSTNSALLLPADAQVRFVVSANNQIDSRNSGTVSLSYTAWDASSGIAGSSGDTTAPSSTSPFSSAGNTATLNVTPVNNPPVFSSSPLTVNEHSSVLLTGGFTNDSTQVAALTGNLRIYDPDNSTAQILYRIEELPAKGTLTLNGATLTVGSLFSQSNISSITYTPTVGELTADTTDRVYFTIRDGAGGVIGSDGKNTGANPWPSLEITIKDVNAQVTVSGTTLAIAEDNVHPGVPVTAPIPLSMSDADDPSGLRTLTITSLPAATFGTLQYLDGSSYQTVTTGLSFTQAQLTDAVHPALRFVYNNSTEPTDQNGALIPAESQTSFNVSISDNNDHLTATTASATVNINITPVNDAPVLVTYELSVIQGSGDNAIGTGNLTTTDPDSPANLRTYTVSIDPERGYLTLNGVRIGRGSTFSESDLNSGILKYTCNDAYYHGSDSLQVAATDGNGADSGVKTLAITIIDSGVPLPVYPNTDPSSGDTTSITGTLKGISPEGLFLTIDTWMLSDPVPGSIFTVTEPAHGKLYLNGVEIVYGTTTFTQADINNANVVYLHDGSEPNSYSAAGGTDFLDTLKITATKGAATVSHDFTITITPVDDAPTITQTNVGPIILNQNHGTLIEQQADGSSGLGSTDFTLDGIFNAVKLTTDNFQWHDIDNTQNQLTYMASTVGGTIGRWNGSVWLAVTSFSADDLAAGNIAYFHNPADDVAAPDDTTMTGSVTVHLIDGGIVAAGDVSISPPSISEETTLTVTDGITIISLAKDSQMRSPDRTVTFTIADVNDAPVASNNSFTVTEFSSGIPGQTDHIQVLTTALVAVSDSDTANTTWTYTLTALPTNGTIQKWNGSTWNDMAVNATFTYAELNAGNLRYVNSGRIEVTGGYDWNIAHDSFKFKVNDGELISSPKPLDSNEATVAIFLRPTNQPPLVVNNGPGSVPEGGALQITDALLGSADATNSVDIVKAIDPDNTRMQVQYRIIDNVDHGFLYLGDSTTGTVTKQLSVGSAFTLEDIQSGRLWYQHNGTEAAPYSNQDTFTYAISDASGMIEPTAVFVINLVPINDAPVVTGLAGGAIFTEGDTSGSPNVSPVLIDSNITLSDSDLANNGADFRGGSLTISDTFASKSSDQLSVKNIGTGAGQIGYNAGNGIVTYGGVQIGSVIVAGAANGVNGNDLMINFTAGANASLTIPGVKALIEAITFSHTEYDNAITGTRTLNYTLVDGGGTASYTDSKHAIFTGADTWQGSATVTVVAANDRPIVTDHTGGGNLSLGTITEDNTSTPTAFQVSSFITAVNGSADSTHTGIADVDAGALPGIAITNLTNAATGHWDYSIDSSSGWTTITGVSTGHALLLTATDYVRFVPDGKDGGTSTITYLAWDTTSGSARTYVDSTINTTQTSAFSTATDTAELIVTPVNDAPTLGGSGIDTSATVHAIEDIATTLNGLSSLALADVDAGSHQVKVTLTLTGIGTFGFSTATAGVSTSSSSSVAPNLSGYSGTLELYGTAANLNTALSKLQYLSVVDANQNNPDGSSGTTLVITADDQGWGINDVQTSALTTTKTLNITIDPANDTPTLTVATGTLNVNENTQTTVSNTIQVADIHDILDSNYGNGTWANPTLVITALHGTLSLNAAATNLSGVLTNSDHTLTLTSLQTGANVLADLNEALNTHQYINYLPDTNFSGTDTLSLTLNDNGNAGGGNKIASGTISIAVNGINNAPSIVGLDSTSANTFAENGPGVVLDSNATLYDPELSVYNNWGNASLIVARNGGADNDDVFGLTGSSGTGVNFNGVNNVRIGTTDVATFTNAGGQLQITFNDGVTNTQANQILQAITYTNTNDNPPSSVTIGYTINDGDQDPDRATNGQGTGGSKTDSPHIIVNITTTNDAPTLTGLSAKSFTEDGAAVVIGTGATPGDPELTIFAGNAGNWGNAKLTISRNGGASPEDSFSASGTLSALTPGTLSDGGTTIGTITANSGGTLAITFAEDVTTSQIQAAMQKIAYSNSRQVLGAGATAPVTLNWLVEDGDTDPDRDTNSQGAGGNKSVTFAQTITLIGTNDAPTGVDDTAIAVEAGGIANGTPGSNGTGNVLTNDTDVDTVGDSRTVNGARTGTEAVGGALTAVSGGTTSANGLQLVGAYGKLTLGTDGTYSYTVDNANATVQALRVSGQTVTDTFTYRLTDTGGLTDTAQLTVTIDGSNDNPVGVNDTATAVEAGGIANGTLGSNGTGNVLTNDTDVDTVGETKTVNRARTGTEAAGGALTAVSGGTTSANGLQLVGAFGTLTLGADGSYSYAVDNANATVQALRVSGQTLTDTFTYRLTDTGGLTDTAQLTVTIDGSNDNPVGVNDTATAVEAGGISSGTLGSNGTGNVLTNDTDVDTVGETKTVNGARTGTEAAGGALTAVSGATTSANGLQLVGAFGTLTLGADGSYSYAVDNANATVQALRISSQTLTDTFTYRLTDTGGLTDTAQLIVTIDGRNDNPIGVDDTATAVEAGGIANSTAGSNGSGNVLTNDTDVDAGDTKTVNAARTGTEAAGGALTAVSSGTTSADGLQLVGAFGTLTLGADGTYSYAVDNANATVQALRVSGQTLTDSFTYRLTDTGGLTDTAQLTVTIDGRNDNPVGVDDTAAAVEAGGIANGTPGSNGTDNVLANDTDVDTVGETKTVNGARTGTEAAGGALTAVSGGTTSADGLQLVGAFGTLTLGADGSYSYAVDNANATVQALRISGQTLTDSFTYRLTDTGGLTDTAQLTVTIDGRNDNPIGVDDTAAAVEAGGIANATPGSNGSGNVLNNDTDVDAGDSKTVNAARTGTKAAGGALTAVSGGTTSADGLQLTGSYGTLTLGADGSYSYAVDNANATVQALRISGQTLTDSFTYRLTDTGGLTDTAQLTVTIDGRNDNPIGVDDTAAAVEAGGIANGTPGSNDSGNVLNNDTDVDAGDSKTVDAARTGTEAAGGALTAVSSGTTSANGLQLVGAYGTLTLGADGTYSYTVDNANATVQALRVSGQTVTDTFTYRLTDTGDLTDTVQLTVTIDGRNDNPVAIPNTGAVTQDATLSVNAAAGVLQNDTDVDATDTRTVIQLAQGSTTQTVTSGTPGVITSTFGTLTLNSDGSYSYLADGAASKAVLPGHTATDTFAYTMCDSDGLTSSTSLTITITGLNEAPVAVADTGTAVEAGGINNETPGSDATGNVLDNDTDIDVGDTKTVVSVTGAGAGIVNGATPGAHGTLSLNTDGTYIYKVDNNDATVQALRTNGDTLTDTFTYTMKDAIGTTSSTTLTVTLHGANDTPVAILDTGGAIEAGGVDNSTPGSDATGNVLTNDTDVDSIANGETKIVTAVSGTGAGMVAGTTAGSHGTLHLDADGTYTYKVDNNDAAVQALRTVVDTLTDTFTYTVKDTAGALSTTTLTIVIHGANDAPIAADDTGHSPDGRPVTVAVLGNDTDMERETLTVTRIAGVALVPGGTVPIPEGSVRLNANGTITLTPNAGFQGNAVFSYEISDGNGGTAAANVAISVVPEPAVFHTGPEPLLTPGYTLFGDQSDHFYGEGYDNLIRQPIPYEPTMYVHQAVSLAQLQRMGTDPLSFSNPDMVRMGDIESRSIGAGLGIDPAVFVRHAVRDSQAGAEFIDNIVNGRLTRISLSSDRSIPTPDLYQPDPREIIPPINIAKTAVMAERHILAETPKEAEIPMNRSTVGLYRETLRAAPSFSEQIRTAGGYRPITGSGTLRQRSNLKPF